MDHVGDEDHLLQMEQDNFILELRHATHLRNLKMSLPQSSTINVMLKTIPKIERLDFAKCIGRNTLDLFQQVPGQNFKELMSSILGFKSLKLLAFPDISTLGVGYRNPVYADIVNRPYKTKTEDMMTIPERIEKEKAEHDLAYDMFLAIPSLERVYFSTGRIRAWKGPNEEGRPHIFFAHEWDVPPSEMPYDDGFNTVIALK
ncbi:MAG: hypothetical protein Q9165_007930 [Trypethelium subeluteriae]